MIKIRNFAKYMDYTLNCRGRLLSLSVPQVMGIVNVTPDSFFAASRQQTERAIAERVGQILSEGGTIVDIGACSTRPDSTVADESVEMQRLRLALSVVCREYPDAIVSVDTFRPQVARMAVEEFGASIINDVGSMSTAVASADLQPMFRMVSSLGVPYIYTSHKSNVSDVLLDSAAAISRLRSYGQKDILLDPGFGFGKTLADNYSLLDSLEQLQVMQLPVLVGVSRKSMVWRLLSSTPEEALNGTTALHAIALLKGASVLRVHDVREAVECVKICSQLTAGSVGQVHHSL